MATGYYLFNKLVVPVLDKSLDKLKKLSEKPNTLKKEKDQLQIDVVDGLEKLD